MLALVCVWVSCPRRPVCPALCRRLNGAAQLKSAFELSPSLPPPFLPCPPPFRCSAWRPPRLARAGWRCRLPLVAHARCRRRRCCARRDQGVQPGAPPKPQALALLAVQACCRAASDWPSLMTGCLACLLPNPSSRLPPPPLTSRLPPSLPSPSSVTAELARRPGHRVYRRLHSPTPGPVPSHDGHRRARAHAQVGRDRPCLLSPAAGLLCAGECPAPLASSLAACHALPSDSPPSACPPSSTHHSTPSLQECVWKQPGHLESPALPGGRMPHRAQRRGRPQGSVLLCGEELLNRMLMKSSS